MKTASGFEFELDRSRLDNMEVLDLFADLQDLKEDSPEAVMVIRKLMTLIIGKATLKRLDDHVRDESGRVPIGAFLLEATSIFNMLGEDAKK